MLTEPPSSAPDILSVSQLNQAVSRMLERSFPLAWVAGEISNFTRAASGHWYFTLKDSGAQVRAVMFRGRAQYADFNPREGDKVEVLMRDDEKVRVRKGTDFGWVAAASLT